MVVRYRLMPRNVACLDYKKKTPITDNGMDMSNSKHPFWSWVTEDLFVNHYKGLHVFGPFSPDGKMELFCTHLAIWDQSPNVESMDTDKFEDEGMLSLENIRNSYTTIMPRYYEDGPDVERKGKEVENVWG